MNTLKDELSISSSQKAELKQSNDNGFVSILSFAAWAYLILSMIGAVVLFKEKLVLYGFSALIAAIIIYLVLYGIARIIEQNNNIINMLNDTDQE